MTVPWQASVNKNADIGQLPRVDIVIPVYNKLAKVQACVQSLLATTTHMREQVRITIVDDRSTEQGMTEWYKRASEMGVNIVTNAGPSGFASTCNTGVAATAVRLDVAGERQLIATLAERDAAKPLTIQHPRADTHWATISSEWQTRFGEHGRFVCLLNSDVVALPGWLDALLAVFDTHARIGVVGPKLLFPENSADQARPAGRVQSCGFYYNVRRVPQHRFIGWSRNNKRVNQFRDDLQGITGAVLLMPRDMWNAVQGFRAEYGSTFEDAELGLAVRALGLKVAYCPEAELYHEAGGSYSPERPFPIQRNLQLFQQRCGQWVQYDQWLVT